MTDTELQYTDRLMKDCVDHGTWSQRIDSACRVKGLIETSAKVGIIYFFVNEFDQSTMECFIITCNQNQSIKQPS